MILASSSQVLGKLGGFGSLPFCPKDPLYPPRQARVYRVLHLVYNDLVREGFTNPLDAGNIDRGRQRLVDLVIRELTGPDLTTHFLETLANLAPVQLNVPEALEIYRRRLRNGVRTYIALVKGQVAGTLSLVVEQKYIHQGGWVGHIEDVAVHADFVNKGIGSALVDHALEEAKRLGCYKAILSCFEDRVPFYERLGFRRHDVGMRVDL
jgi:glucosamine-phosphate N-acetyltransferase